MKKIQIFLIVLAVILLGVIVFVSARSAKNRAVAPAGEQQISGKYDAIAMCLKEKGAVFYGAFWCSHCNATKALFESSVELLPYVECSTPDGAGQLEVCKEKKIMGYPTWEFADGSRLSGEVPMATLAEKTGCALPQ